MCATSCPNFSFLFILIDADCQGKYSLGSKKPFHVFWRWPFFLGILLHIIATIIVMLILSTSSRSLASFITIMIAGNWARVTSLLVTISIRWITSWPSCPFPSWGCCWPCHIFCNCWWLMCSYCIQWHCFNRHFQLSISTKISTA